MLAVWYPSNVGWLTNFSILTTTGSNAMNICATIHGPQRVYLDNFGSPQLLLPCHREVDISVFFVKYLNNFWHHLIWYRHLEGVCLSLYMR